MNRREFIQKLLIAGAAFYATCCEKPTIDPEPPDPNGNGGNGNGNGGNGNTQPRIDNRDPKGLETTIYNYATRTIPTKRYQNTEESTAFEKAFADLSKFIEDLILDKNYDIGKFSHVACQLTKFNQAVHIDSVSINTQGGGTGLTVTNNTTCKTRTVSKGLEIYGPRAADFFHTIGCDEEKCEVC